MKKGIIALIYCSILCYILGYSQTIATTTDCWADTNDFIFPKVMEDGLASNVCHTGGDWYVICEGCFWDCDNEPESSRYIVGVAQPYLIDTTISIKAIALCAFLNVVSWYDTTILTQGDPVVQLIDMETDSVIIEAPYDTLTTQVYPSGQMKTAAYYQVNFDSSVYVNRPFLAAIKFRLPADQKNDRLTTGRGAILLKGAYCDPPSMSIPPYQSSCDGPTHPRPLFKLDTHTSWHPVNDMTLPSEDIGVLHTLNAVFILPVKGFKAADHSGDSTNVGGDTSFVSEIDLEKSITIYPNPIQEVLNVKTDLEIKKVEVCSVMGQPIYMKLVRDNKVAMDVSQLESGPYIVKVYTTKGVATKIIIKTKGE